MKWLHLGNENTSGNHVRHSFDTGNDVSFFCGAGMVGVLQQGGDDGARLWFSGLVVVTEQFLHL